MPNLIFEELNLENLDLIQPLWERLNEHHQKVSPYFWEDFEQKKWTERKKDFTKDDRQLKVFIAKENSGNIIAYCAASIAKDNKGEINSIYIEANYRKLHIGTELMKQALQWFERKGISEIIISVAVGNEEALNFYEKFGFKPRTYYLKRKANFNNT